MISISHETIKTSISSKNGQELNVLFVSTVTSISLTWLRYDSLTRKGITSKVRYSSFTGTRKASSSCAILQTSTRSKVSLNGLGKYNKEPRYLTTSPLCSPISVNCLSTKNLFVLSVFANLPGRVLRLSSAVGWSVGRRQSRIGWINLLVERIPNRFTFFRPMRLNLLTMTLVANNLK